MLKRQRASSPFPQSPSIPQDITPPGGIIDLRDLKRRRVTPPSLDGQARGWNTHSNSSSAVEEHDEEDYIEDERHGRSEANFAQSKGNAEYAEMFIPPAPLSLNVPRGDLPHAELNKNPLAHQTSAEESARVYEHYEGANRSLASAFLARRQHNAGQP